MADDLQRKEDFNKMTLFIDPFEATYPSTVRVLLNDFEKRKNVCATVTPLGKCLLICENHIYIWSCVTSEDQIPNAIHMELPATGLKHTTKLVCLFNKASYCKHLSLLVISPEGRLRYWAELGRQTKNEQCLLNNEVAHSIQPIDSQENLHRFLLTTTTGSFHLIELFHGMNQPDRLATRPIDVGGPGGGIGRRMSLLLFGSFTAEKEQILKTIFLHGKMGRAVDVVNVLSRYLRFYALVDQKAQSHEVDVADLAITKYNHNRERPERRHFQIVDAAQYKSGILLFLVGEKEAAGGADKRFLIDRKIFLAYYEEPKDGTTHQQHGLRTLIRIRLSNSLSVTGLEKRLQTASLHCPGPDECCIAFYDSFLLIRNPIKTIFELYELPSYAIEHSRRQGGGQHEYREVEGDTLLGVAAIKGCCQLVLKEAGICAVRRLPCHYDLSFWKKYRSILNQLDTMEGFTVTSSHQHRLKDAFVDFCSKDMKRTKNVLEELNEQMQQAMESEEIGHDEMTMMSSGRKSRAVNKTDKDERQKESFAEMAVDLLLFFLDREPSAQEDPRWAFKADAPISSDQREQLRKLAETRKFNLVLKHLQVKLAFYKMFVIFLRTFDLIERTDYPLQTYKMQSGKAIVVELGEKLVAMIASFRWLSEHSESLPLVNRAMGELSKQYVTRYGLPRANPFLSPTDYVFNKVSTFHELVSAVVQAGGEAMAEDNRNQTKARNIREVGSLFLTLIEGVQDARCEEWALKMEEEFSTWLSQPDFLTHFITHLNMALDYLESMTGSSDESDKTSTLVFEQCIRLANFVLSQQSQNQRDDSKIISRFAALGHQDIALQMAEKYKDFTFLVVYCHNKLDKRRCEEALNRYKEEYKDEFYIFLYTWYQRKGLRDKSRDLMRDLKHWENETAA